MSGDRFERRCDASRRGRSDVPLTEALLSSLTWLFNGGTSWASLADLADSAGGWYRRDSKGLIDDDPQRQVPGRGSPISKLRAKSRAVALVVHRRRSAEHPESVELERRRTWWNC